MLLNILEGRDDSGFYRVLLKLLGMHSYLLSGVLCTPSLAVLLGFARVCRAWCFRVRQSRVYTRHLFRFQAMPSFPGSVSGLQSKLWGPSLFSIWNKNYFKAVVVTDLRNGRNGSVSFPVCSHASIAGVSLSSSTQNWLQPGHSSSS